ncbi:MAG: DUF2764 family protein [Rikenellaceae bacterium]
MFSKQYICLVAGLHEYTIDSDAKGLNLAALLEEIYDDLSKSDAVSVRLLYGYYDCENIAAAYASRSSFNPLGQLSKESVAAIVAGDESGEENPLELLPESVVRVVEAYTSKEAKSDLMETSQSFDRALFTAYYEACAVSKSRLLREWSEADRNLRNVAAAITARGASRPVEDVVVGDGGVVDQLVKSSAADFGLRGELSYIDAVIGAVSDEPNLIEKERRIDLVRWDVVEELMEGEYFSIDYILGYLVKVNIVARWRSLDLERGREMFAKLMSELSGKDLIK